MNGETSNTRKPHETKQKSLARSVCEQGLSSGDDRDRTGNLRLANAAALFGKIAQAGNRDTRLSQKCVSVNSIKNRIKQIEEW